MSVASSRLRSCLRPLAAGVLAASLVWPVGLSAQTVDFLEQQRIEREQEFERVTRELEASQQRQLELANEIDKVRDDRAAVTAALIQAAKTERKLSEDIADIETRLESLLLRREDIQTSLRARRGTLAEVLGALQRMGLNPPPAILVRPEDALSSVRSAILLGAVVPELRSETEMLATDLRELSRVVASINDEQERLTEKITAQAKEKQRLEALLEEQQRMQAEAEGQMREELEQAEALAMEADSLQALIGALQSKIASLSSRLEEQRENAREGTGLEELVPFSERRGMVPLPVSGSFTSRFGEEDSTGAALKGDILRTQSGAIVTSPADGTVLYAGPFRSYGQLLILDPGDDYHIVLAGMDRLNVKLGQRVLAGEPVGLMGEARLASIAAGPMDGSERELYVEFRKDGTPVDPRRWWARETPGRMGNDT